MSREKSGFQKIICGYLSSGPGEPVPGADSQYRKRYCFPRSSRVRKNHPASRIVMEAPAEAPT